jgi:hypothetical protein
MGIFFSLWQLPSGDVITRSATDFRELLDCGRGQFLTVGVTFLLCVWLEPKCPDQRRIQDATFTSDQSSSASDVQPIWIIFTFFLVCRIKESRPSLQVDNGAEKSGQPAETCTNCDGTSGNTQSHHHNCAPIPCFTRRTWTLMLLLLLQGPYRSWDHAAIYVTPPNGLSSWHRLRISKVILIFPLIHRSSWSLVRDLLHY